MKICEKCYDEQVISKCCKSQIYAGNKCMNCGKFAKLIDCTCKKDITHQRVPPNLTLSKMWVTPSGKVGKSYKSTENQIDVDLIKSKLSKDFNSKYKKTNSNEAVIAVSDLHTGAFVRAYQGTILTKDTDLYKLKSSLDYVAQKINSLNKEAIHLLLPGDLVESFTGLNHNSWKHLQHQKNNIIIVVYELLKWFFEKIINLCSVYLIEGNHDRLTKKYEAGDKKGVVEVVSYFLKENSLLDINYHPFLLTKEIDGINYIVTHGDNSMIKQKDFLYNYGNQEFFNVLVTGHVHRLGLIDSRIKYMHVQCPSIFSGTFFYEQIGYTPLPGFIIIENDNEYPKLQFQPIPTL